MKQLKSTLFQKNPLETYPFEESGTDLGSLGVQGDGDGYAEAVPLGQVLLGLAYVGDGLGVVLVRAVAEVHPGDVHAGLDHLLEHLHRTRGRPDRADYSGQTGEQSVRIYVQGAHVVQVALGVYTGRVRLASHLQNCSKKYC